MQFKNMNLGSTKAVIRVVTASVLLMASYATSAATIGLTPDPLEATVGNSFDLLLTGSDFTQGTNGSSSAGTSGGGVTITWDETIIDLTGVNITFSGDQFFGSAPVLGAGSVMFSVASLNGEVLADFNIATLTFDAVAVGGPITTGVDVSLTDIWADFDSLTDMTPLGVGNMITITPTAIPVPAAVWLFGSGLLGLVGIARRRAVA